MRVCPKCNYKDPVEWRQVPWKFDVDFCHSGDFERLHPNLYRKLVKGHHFVFDDHFAYRFSGKSKKAVWRVWKPLYEWGGKSAFSIPTESVIHKKDPFQIKLFEEPKVTT